MKCEKELIAEWAQKILTGVELKAKYVGTVQELQEARQHQLLSIKNDLEHFVAKVKGVT